MKPSRMPAWLAALTVAATSFVGRAQIVVWPVNGHAYQRVNAAGFTWAAARAAAEAARYESRPGHLVTVNSAEENRFLTEHASLGAGALDRLQLHWMGGYQIEGATEPRGGWAWVTGEPFGFANWSPAEPTDGGEDHALFDHEFNGNGKQWNDAPEDYSIAGGYVIEFEPASAPGQLQWAFQTGGQIMSCPAIGNDGTVYVGLLDGMVYALDGDSGAKRWTFRALPKDANSPALGTNGLLYIGSSGRVYALEAATGSQRWEFATGGGGGSSPALGADGTVYVCSCDANVYALDGTTGQKRWQFGIAGACNTASPAIGTDGTVYVGAGDGTVFAFEGAAGRVRWKFPAGSRVWASPALGADGTVFVGTSDGIFYALEGTTGRPRWSTPLGRPVSSSAAVAPDGTVYVGSDAGKVYAFTSTGGMRWEFQADRGVSSSPAIAADGTVYVGSDDNRLYALEGSTGKLLWSFVTEAGVVSSPAIGADGTVYVGSHDGNLYALRGTSPLADSPWPKFRGDGQNTGRMAGAEPGKAPSVTGEPQDVTAVVGADVTFAVAASGTPPLTYQWRKDGGVLAGSVGAALVLSKVQLDQAGGYSVVITNALGAVTSRVATLTVRLPNDVVVWSVNGHGYQRFDTPGLTWTDARSAAAAAAHQGWPGHLVTIMSAEENRFLTEHPSLGGGNGDMLQQYWLGGVQAREAAEPEGAWMWVTGEPFNFTNWSPGEPNDGGGVEDALMFWGAPTAYGKAWKDGVGPDEGSGLGYVVEYETWSGDDVTPPTLAGVQGDATRTRVTLTFSEAVAAATVSNPANYTLSGDLQVQGATLGGADAATVILTTSTQTPNLVYTLTVNGVTDLAGNRIATDSQGSFTASAEVALGQFIFGNKNLAAIPPIDARMGYYDCGIPLEGEAFSAQAYIKRATDPELSYQPVGTRVHFRTGNNAGYIVPVVVTTPFPGGTAINVEMRIWETASGSTYEEAVGNSGYYGKSMAVTLILTVAPALPSDMTGLQSFSLAVPCQRALTITGQPAGVRVAVDSPFALSVAVDSRGWPYYQWYREGQPILGAKQRVLSVPRAGFNDAGHYHVTVTNYARTAATSQVARVVVGYPLTLTTNGPGRIEVEPVFEVYEPGQQVMLTAVPSGGMAFVGWAGDASDRVNPLTLTMDGVKRVEARFSPEPSRLKWQVAVGGGVLACPAIGHDGTLYVSTAPDRVLALAASSGATRWAASPAAPDQSPAVGADGTVYLAFARGILARDGATGALKWTYETSTPVESSPVVGADGTVYVGCSNLLRQATITALDGAQGTRKWEYLTAGLSRASLAVGALGTVYVGLGTGLFALDGQTGNRTWDFGSSNGLSNPLAIDADGSVYAKFWDGVLSAHDGATGARRWNSRFLGYGNSGPVIGLGDTIFVGSTSNVYAFDGTTGAVTWDFRADNRVETTPAVAADNTVYVVSSAGTLYALDGATGTERWRFRSGSFVEASPALGADGTVYVGTWGGMLYALEGGSGLAPTPWPKFHGDAQNTGQAQGEPPVLEWQPFRAVLSEGAEERITVRFSGLPAPHIQWHFNGVAIPEGTNAVLVFPSVTRALEGLYWAAASNWLGQATCAPMVAVVSNVDPAYFPGWRWEGGGGAVQVLASPSIFGPWTPLFTPPAGATSGYYIETNPAAPSLYYQLQEERGGATARFTATAHVPGWWYEGAVGTRHRIEYVWEGSGWTNWVELTELTLPATPFQFLDTEAFEHPRAVYRSTPVP